MYIKKTSFNRKKNIANYIIKINNKIFKKK